MSDPAPLASPSENTVGAGDKGDPGEEDLLQLLRAGQLLLLKYPIATRAALRAFVSEGKRFAATPEGGAYRTVLIESELLKRARIVWEGASLNMLEDGETSLLPSALLESILAAAASSNLETLLSRLFMEKEPR